MTLAEEFKSRNFSKNTNDAAIEDTLTWLVAQVSTLNGQSLLAQPTSRLPHTLSRQTFWQYSRIVTEVAKVDFT